MSDPTTPDGDGVRPLTVLSFDGSADHCRYDPARILAELTAPEREVIAATFGDAVPDWTTTVDLYCATEELTEAGYPDTAETLGYFIHAENLYGCLCRNEALARFKDQVSAVLADIESRYPAGTWWTPRRDHVYGLDVDDLLEDLDYPNDSSDLLTFTLDDKGNGTVVHDSTTLELVAFPTAELGTFAQMLNAGDFATADGTYWVEDWMRLPAPVRETMAVVHFHDVALTGDGTLTDTGPTRGRDLTVEQLEQLARAVISLPTGDAVLALLPGTTSTLEDLVTAVEATSLPC